VTLAASGGGNLTWTMSAGSLPAGLTLGSNGVVSGTPTGAGVHRNPSVWLKPGDVVEVAVPPIGVLRNTVVDEV